MFSSGQIVFDVSTLGKIRLSSVEYETGGVATSLSDGGRVDNYENGRQHGLTEVNCEVF